MPARNGSEDEPGQSRTMGEACLKGGKAYRAAAAGYNQASSLATRLAKLLQPRPALSRREPWASVPNTSP